MSNMKTDRKTILGLEGDVSELNCMGKLLAIVLDGGIGEAPRMIRWSRIIAAIRPISAAPADSPDMREMRFAVYSS